MAAASSLWAPHLMPEGQQVQKGVIDPHHHEEEGLLLWGIGKEIYVLCQVSPRDSLVLHGQS